MIARQARVSRKICRRVVRHRSIRPWKAERYIQAPPVVDVMENYQTVADRADREKRQGFLSSCSRKF